MLKYLIVACVACVTSACTAVPMQHSQDIVQLQSDSELAAQRVRERHCIRATGTRIVRPDQCQTLPGRVYTPDDLGATGAFSTSEALRRLDPSFR